MGANRIALPPWARGSLPLLIFICVIGSTLLTTLVLLMEGDAGMEGVEYNQEGRAEGDNKDEGGPREPPHTPSKQKVWSHHAPAKSVTPPPAGKHEEEEDSDSSSSDDSPHQLPPGYAVVRFIGAGQEGRTYEVERTDIIDVKAKEGPVSFPVVSRVALRVENTKKSATESLKSATILAALFNHNNIVKQYKSFVYRGKLWTESEYISGETVKDLHDEARHRHFQYPDEAVLHWMSQLMDAVAYMHSLRIAHRDLHWQNILVSGRRTHIKVIDFGDCRRLPEGKELFQADKRDPQHYTSPARNRLEPYGLRDDVWTTGKILYLLLGGPSISSTWFTRAHGMDFVVKERPLFTKLMSGMLEEDEQKRFTAEVAREVISETLEELWDQWKD